MIKSAFKTTKLACYSAYFTMSSIFCVPPILFVTFRELYGISYTLLGTLVLVNFFTQLGIDLLFTAFSKYFNAKIRISQPISQKKSEKTFFQKKFSPELPKKDFLPQNDVETCSLPYNIAETSANTKRFVCE